MPANRSESESKPPIKVLLTRPARQADRLATVLKAHGFEPLCLPMLELSAINELAQVETVKSRIQQLGDCDLAIFISSNAVNYTAAFIGQSALRWPPQLPCLGIGAATNQAIIDQAWCLAVSDSQQLSEQGNDAVRTQTSEALLESLVLREVKDRRITIFRGAGGRELLAEVLRSRGALVEYCESYARHYPKYDKATLLAALDLKDNKVNAIIFASGETLDNFHQHLQDHALTAKLMSVPVIVPSQRVQTLASDYGFKNIITAKNASAEGFLQALKEYFS